MSETVRRGPSGLTSFLVHACGGASPSLTGSTAGGTIRLQPKDEGRTPFVSRTEGGNEMGLAYEVERAELRCSGWMSPLRRSAFLSLTRAAGRL